MLELVTTMPSRIRNSQFFPHIVLGLITKRDELVFGKIWSPNMGDILVRFPLIAGKLLAIINLIKKERRPVLFEMFTPLHIFANPRSIRSYFCELSLFPDRRPWVNCDDRHIKIIWP